MTAQASLNRLRGESRHRAIAATAKDVFANASLFLGATMALRSMAN
jgi:hypothetical protein